MKQQTQALTKSHRNGELFGSLITRGILRGHPELIDDRDLKEIHLSSCRQFLLPLFRFLKNWKGCNTHLGGDDNHSIRLDFHPFPPFKREWLACDHDDTFPLVGFGHPVKTALAILIERCTRREEEGGSFRSAGGDISERDQGFDICQTEDAGRVPGSDDRLAIGDNKIQQMRAGLGGIREH